MQKGPGLTFTIFKISAQAEATTFMLYIWIKLEFYSPTVEKSGLVS